MTRIPLGSLSFYDAPGENAEPPRLLLAMGHPPELADAALGLFRVLLAGEVPARDRKLATLAVAAELENGYEWGHHAETALQFGLTAGDVEAIRQGARDELAPRDQLIVDIALATERRTMTDDLWAAASAELSVAALVQLTVLVGYYGLLARFQSVFEVDQDEGLSGRY